MKFQWNLLIGLVFALMVAVFAVINVEPVRVNYLFGQSDWPLVLVILGSVLMGGIIIGLVGLFRVFILQRQVKILKRENQSLRDELNKDNAQPTENMNSEGSNELKQ